MAKIVINSKIISKDNEITEFNVNGILKDNKITYYEEKSIVSILVCPKEIFLVKEDEEKKLELNFKKGKITHTNYLIKDLNFNINISTKTNELKLLDNGFIIKYELYMNGELSDVFKYTLEWRDL